MSENNGWPERPGVPMNPGRDGWHWLIDSNHDPYLLNWSADTERWGGYPGTSPEDLHTVIGGYCDPCLTPAEHAAALAVAYRRGQEEMLTTARAEGWREGWATAVARVRQEAETAVSIGASQYAVVLHCLADSMQAEGEAQP